MIGIVATIVATPLAILMMWIAWQHNPQGAFHEVGHRVGDRSLDVLAGSRCQLVRASLRRSDSALLRLVISSTRRRTA